MEDLAKFILLLLLALPFIALAMDAINKTKGFMIIVVFGVAMISALIALGMRGGLHQRPNVANLYCYAFIAWPIALLTAKGMNPNLPWRYIWLSVPVMSWFLVNMSMQFYYPTNGGGGGLGLGLGLVAGWLYMVVPFAFLCAIFIGGRGLARRMIGEQGAAADSPNGL